MLEIFIEFTGFLLLSAAFFWLGLQWKQQSFLEISNLMEYSEVFIIH
jgi:hypothetical protein